MSESPEEAFRRKCEEEVELDLKKPLSHLLTDVYVELLYPTPDLGSLVDGLKTRPLDDNMRHAQKRLSALQTRIANDSMTVSRRSFIVSAISAGIALIALVVSLISLCR